MAIEGVTRPEPFLDDSDSLRFYRRMQVWRSKRLVGGPLSSQINPDEDISDNALMMLESPQHTTVQEACRAALQLPPSVGTAVGVHG